MSYEGKVRFILTVPCKFFKSTRPFKRKIRFWQIANINDDPDLIAAIDQALGFREKEEPTEGETEKAQGDKSATNPGTTNIEPQVLEQWRKIRGDPRIALFCFHFKRGFSHPMLKGKEIYGYTFFDLTDMAQKIGRHNTIMGWFLEDEISYYHPPSKDRWVEEQLEILRMEGRLTSARDIRECMKTLRKQYKRAVSKRKFINLLFIPGWTRQGFMRMYQHTRKMQNLPRVIHATEAELGPTIAQAVFHEEGYKALQKVSGDKDDEIRKSHVIIRNLSSELDANDRKMKGMRKPTKTILVGRPQVGYVRPPPVTGQISRAFKGMDVGTIMWTGLFLLSAIFLFMGMEMYMRDTSSWGALMIFAVLFVSAIVVFLVKRREGPPPRELVEQIGETVREEMD